MGNWFEVDKAGLSALTQRRDKGFILAELLANAWDAPGATQVSATVERISGRPEALITVIDDSPEGFTRLDDAFTLFAHTDKRANAEQRGRFNLGEKLSLALATEARISSTKGTVIFDRKGRRATSARRARGSEVQLRVPMTGADTDAALELARTFIPPIATTLNGAAIQRREPIASFAARLPTELQEGDGPMRRTVRATQVDVYPPLRTEGWLYELGIPVCATGDTFDVDVRQKVPLSLERESVSDTYLRRVRAVVLGNTAHLLEAADAAAPWVTQALEDPAVPAPAVAAIVAKRFGDKAVVYDPSDQEANKLAVSRGYTVVHGGAFSGAAWAAIKAAEALRPAGQVTPSPRPWAEEGTPVAPLTPTPEQARFARWCQALARPLIGGDIAVEFFERFNDPNTRAAYGGRTLQLSVRRLGRAWFAGPIGEDQLDLLLHELGHEFEGDHLSSAYHRALTRLGARLALLARERPQLLELPPTT